MMFGLFCLVAIARLYPTSLFLTLSLLAALALEGDGGAL